MSLDFAGGVATVSSGFQVEYTAQTSPLQALLLARAAKSTGFGFGAGNAEFNIASDATVQAAVSPGFTLSLSGAQTVGGGSGDYGRVLYLRLENLGAVNVVVTSSDLAIDTTLTPGSIVTREYAAPGIDVSSGSDITLTSPSGTPDVRISVIGRRVVTP